MFFLCGFYGFFGCVFVYDCVVLEWVLCLDVVLVIVFVVLVVVDDVCFVIVEVDCVVFCCCCLCYGVCGDGGVG